MAAPVSSILYMCHVLETDIPYSFDDGKVRMDHIMRLKLQQRFPADALTREKLRECDIASVRSPRYATDSLLREVSRLTER